MQANERYRDLLIIENMVTLNSAFCRRHMTHCPPSEQLTTECRKVRDNHLSLLGCTVDTRVNQTPWCPCRRYFRRMENPSLPCTWDRV